MAGDYGKRLFPAASAEVSLQGVVWVAARSRLFGVVVTR
jgi:hypothetical protein